MAKSAARLWFAALCIAPAGLLFAPPPSGPWVLASADFDGDGTTDLAIANAGERVVNVRLSRDKTVEVALDFVPVALAAGDMNGDGRPDLVVAGPKYLDVFLWNGRGKFQAGGRYEIGDIAASIAVGDLNGDGLGDIVALGGRSQRVFVLLSNADGTMRPPASYALGHTPAALAVGDFNRDGRLDLVVADAATNRVLQFAGNGDGTFHSEAAYLVGPLPHSLVVGDFNGDGIADVAVAGLGDDKVRLLLGTPRGTLEPGDSYEAKVGWSPLVLVDRNLVWADATSGALRTLQTRSDKIEMVGVKFAASTPDPKLVICSNCESITLTASPNPSTLGESVTLTANVNTLNEAVTTGRVTFYNGTTVLGSVFAKAGIAELHTIELPSGTTNLRAYYSGDSQFSHITSANVSHTVTAKPGTGFHAIQLAVGANPLDVATGDFNGDGKMDLAVANGRDNNVSVFLGDGRGGFNNAPGSPYPVGKAPCHITVSDIDGDGNEDLVVANGNDNSVVILAGDGTGHFTAASPALSPFKTGVLPNWVDAGDFNGDGLPDLVVANIDSLDVRVYASGIVDGGLAAVEVAMVGDSRSVAIGDYNGDGIADLAVAGASGTVTIMPGRGTGTFYTEGSFHAGNFPVWIATGDFNGDGKLDLATVNTDGNDISIALGNGMGAFTLKGHTAVGNSPAALAIGDFNGDGKLDLAVINDNDNTLTVLLGDGSGGFTAASGSPFPTGQGPLGIRVADFNGDGRADIAVANSNSNTVTLLLATGGSTRGDFDGNGTPDLVWQNDSTSQVALWLMGGPQGSQFQSFSWVDPVGQPGWSVATVADLNQDGVPDIILQNTNGQAVVWYMGGAKGSQFQNWAWLQSSPLAGWKIVSAVDLNGDGVPDLFWQNTTNGQVAAWYMTGAGGSQFQSFAMFPSGPPGWNPVGMADFDGDGHPDLVWQNASTRQAVVWYMGGPQGNQILNWSWLQSGTNTPTWKIVGLADVDANGHPDLIWQEDTSRAVVVWYMTGAAGNQTTGSAWLAGTTTGWHALTAR